MTRVGKRGKKSGVALRSLCITGHTEQMPTAKYLVYSFIEMLDKAARPHPSAHLEPASAESAVPRRNMSVVEDGCSSHVAYWSVGSLCNRLVCCCRVSSGEGGWACRSYSCNL
jgi:hypothetical protein